jgi:hypothetical protein
MSARVGVRRLVGAFAVCAVAGGLVGWSLSSGTLVVDASWLAGPPPAPSVGAWKPLPPKPTVPPSTYPVVAAPPPGAPPARYLQPVYAVPSDAKPDPNLPLAVLHEVGEATAWFRSELDGAYPRFAPDGEAPTVVTVELPWTSRQLATAERQRTDIAPWLHDQHRIEPRAVPVIYLEGTTDEAVCGWASVGADWFKLLEDRNLGPDVLATFQADFERFERKDHIMIILRECPEERPSLRSHWPDGGTRLLAHEATHALGAVDRKAPHYVENGHTGDDPHDIVHTKRGLTDRYTIDPGHDDYYHHGRPDVIDIAESTLLVHPPGSVP